MKFVQLILRKIIKIVATRCQILRLKCTKFDFGWGSPQTPLESLQCAAPPDSLAGFEGLLLREGREKVRGVRGEEKGGERRPFW